MAGPMSTLSCSSTMSAATTRITAARDPDQQLAQRRDPPLELDLAGGCLRWTSAVRRAIRWRTPPPTAMRMRDDRRPARRRRSGRPAAASSAKCSAKHRAHGSNRRRWYYRRLHGAYFGSLRHRHRPALGWLHRNAAVNGTRRQQHGMGMERRRTGFRFPGPPTDKEGEEDAPTTRASRWPPPRCDEHDRRRRGRRDLAPETRRPPETPPTEPAAEMEAPAVAPATDRRRDATRRHRREPTPESESSDFMVDLVGAMRGVAETPGTPAWPTCAPVDAHIEQAERELDRRRNPTCAERAELDLQGSGNGSGPSTSASERRRRRGVTRAAAGSTSSSPSTTRTSEREVEAIRDRLAEHERELGGLLRPARRDQRSGRLRGGRQAHAGAAQLDSTSAPTDAPATETETPQPDRGPAPGGDGHVRRHRHRRRRLRSGRDRRFEPRGRMAHAGGRSRHRGGW